MRLAAVDIGSNAVRLLIAELLPNKKGEIRSFRKIKLFRVPVRLGVDVFDKGSVSTELLDKLIKTMNIYKGLMEIYEVQTYRVTATSAMREAKNSDEVMHRVQSEADIDIKIIDGKTEAELILSNREQINKIFDDRFSHLYVDVGGGSTEISLLSSEGLHLSRSFKIGTVRLLKGKVKAAIWKEIRIWLEAEIRPKVPLNVIGSGGNINCILKRSGNMRFQPLMFEHLKKERDLLSALSIEERIELQDLNEDRAEVIVHALDIFLFIMEHTGIRQVVVPKIGLADGVIRSLFFEQLALQKG